MKTELLEREVVTIGTQDNAAYKIKATAKAFAVMIDGLYSDKIRAAIRETWTNAFDSHVAVGTPDRPFDCQLPSVFEPEFRVRDYGTSLDHEDVMNLYSTLFESTKEDSNEGVGKFGLGSKSPFAYTDSFTVTCWMGEMQRTYSCYKDGQGYPRVALLDTSPSTEENGLQVSFPVAPNDTREFAKKAGQVARGFDNIPAMICDPDTLGTFEKEREVEIITQGDGWYMYDVKDYYSSAQAYAKQGCVLYPIEPDYLRNINDETRHILEANIVIEFPIGDVDIAPSREALSYDATTQANIVARVVDIHAKIAEEFTTKFDSCATLWEATKEFNLAMKDKHLNNVVQRVLGQKVKYRGKTLKSTITLDMRIREQLRNRTMVITPGQAARGLTYRSKNQWEGKWVPDSINFVDGADTFYIDVIPTGGSNRGAGAKIAHDLRKQSGGPNMRGVWIKVREGTLDLQRFMVAAGRPDADAFVYVTDLEDAPKSASVRSSRGTVKCKILKVGTYGGDWHDEDVSTDDTDIVYLETSRNKFMVEDGYAWSIKSIKDAVVFLKTNDFIPADTRIVMIPGTHRKKIDRAGDNWTEFFSLVKQSIESVLTPAVLALGEEKDRLSKSREAARLVTGLEKHGMLPRRRTLLREAIIKLKIVNRRLDRLGSTDTLMSLARLSNLPTELTDEQRETMEWLFTEDTAGLVAQFIDQEYPMIPTGHFYNTPDFADTSNYMQYVTLVDNASG